MATINNETQELLQKAQINENFFMLLKEKFQSRTDIELMEFMPYLAWAYSIMVNKKTQKEFLAFKPNPTKAVGFDKVKPLYEKWIATKNSFYTNDFLASPEKTELEILEIVKIENNVERKEGIHETMLKCIVTPAQFKLSYTNDYNDKISFLKNMQEIETEAKSDIMIMLPTEFKPKEGKKYAIVFVLHKAVNVIEITTEKNATDKKDE